MPNLKAAVDLKSKWLTILLPKTVDEVVNLATRKSVINPETWAEGLVFRPLKERFDPDLGRLSFKAVNPEFLLSYGEE